MSIRDLVDLSVPLDDGTWIQPGDPPYVLEPHSTIERDGFTLAALHLGTHTGTHVDAPFHFDPAAPTLDRLPLDRFLGPAVVADVRHTPARSPIRMPALEPVLPAVRPGVILLLRTGWDRHRGTPAFLDHPYLDDEACATLLDAGVRTIGIDAPSIDATPDDDGYGYPVHHRMARAHAVICEGLVGLGSVVPGATVSLLPLAITGADGSPVRAVAYRESDPVR